MYVVIYNQHDSTIPIHVISESKPKTLYIQQSSQCSFNIKLKRLQGKIAVVFQNAYTANSGKPTKKAIYQQAGIVPELVFKLGR